MNHIDILDCTLRDGGYCNQWNFGFENIIKIINGLIEAKIDIIECGFLTNKVVHNNNVTNFNKTSEIIDVLPGTDTEKMFVAMINYGEYDIEELPDKSESTIQGIRVAFHKKDRDAALAMCKMIQNKGYKVFVQPMVSLSYSDEEFMDLIRKSNEIKPYAFYIVDSFGMMKKKSLMRMFYMVEHNLSEDIKIGFHSHNNIQMAYSNAQSLVEVQTKRNIIIDSSIYGMGRGAGNLNTELFMEYLNETSDSDYVIKPILNVIDEVLNPIYEKNYWGYSLPNYLSATHMIHPNYASYLSEKKTLTVEAMDEIFSMVNAEKGVEFDKAYIEKLYNEYMIAGETQNAHLDELKEELIGRKVLLIAPGKSSTEEKDKILEFIRSENPITISINFAYPYYDVDYVFVSNLRRFRELNSEVYNKTITTSNISSNDVYIRTSYQELLNSVEKVRDNAGMMLIQLLINLKVKDIILAGLDGYSHDLMKNYGEQEIEFLARASILDALNMGLSEVLNKYKKMINIHFLTKSRIDNNLR